MSFCSARIAISLYESFAHSLSTEWKLKILELENKLISFLEKQASSASISTPIFSFLNIKSILKASTDSSFEAKLLRTAINFYERKPSPLETLFDAH